MKRIISLIFIPFALALAGCDLISPEPMTKSEVEAGFAKVDPSQVPTAVLDNCTISADFRSIEVTATFSGIDESMDALKVGILYGSDPTFVASSYKEIEAINGKVVVSVPSKPSAANYIMAVAESSHGVSYSETKSVDVPEIPWYVLVAETYYAEVTSNAKGQKKTYKNKISVKFNEDFSKMIITNIDPYLAIGNGISYEATGGTYNYIVADVDLEARTVSAPMLYAGYPFFDTNFLSFDPYNFCGLAYDSEFNAAESFVLTFSKDGSTISVPPMGTYSLSDDEDNAGLWEICDAAEYVAL